MKKRTVYFVLLAAMLAAVFTGTAYADVTRYLTEPGEYGHLYVYTQISPRCWEYGFCDEAGNQVTDPNYTSIERIPLEDSFCFVTEAEDEDGNYLYQVISRDGQTVSDICFTGIRAIGSEYILCMRSENTFELLDSSLRICATELDFQYLGRQLIPDDYQQGRYICTYAGSYVLLDSSMEPIGQSAPRICFDRFGNALFTDVLDRISVLRPDNTQVSVDGCSAFLAFAQVSEELSMAILPDGSCRFISKEGCFLWPETQKVYIGWNGGYILTGDPEDPECIHRNLSRNGELLLEGTGPDYAEWQDLGFGRYFSRHEDGATVIRNFDTGEQYVIPADTYHEVLWADDSSDTAVCSYYMEEERIHLFMPDGTMHTVDIRTLNAMTDPITGDTYFITADADSGLTLRGSDYKTVLFSFSGWYDICDGIIAVTGEDLCTLYRPDGSVLFSHRSGPKG